MEELTISSDAPGEKLYLLGNEAIARGAIEAGVQVAAAYPGTPSSEILGSLARVARDVDMYVEWSVNEKVAFEVALGASICGVRAMASMKHVGVNVCHDPLMTASYIGAIGGLVLLSADDPSAWSSQNEQDNRYIAEQAYIPVLEPSSVQEAKDMMFDAFRLSEEFNHPFMVRAVTRICHARSDVLLGKILQQKRKAFFRKDPFRFSYNPAGARRNRPLMIERFRRIEEAVNTLAYNELNLVLGARLGIIACGLSHSYTLDVITELELDGKVSVLKIGTPHPLPEELVKRLLNSVEEILVVEELEPFVENHVKVIAQEAGMPVKIHGKDFIPLIGELSPRKVTEGIVRLTGAEPPPIFKELDELSERTASLLPLRPPILCAGCPHRASNYAIKVASKRVARDYGKGIEPIYAGDIGCYGLAIYPPLETVDTTVCMGSGFGLVNGMAHVVQAPIIAMLGDSTFFHAGIPPLINAVYNKANVTMVVFDNTATSMTGFQPHPGTGHTAVGDETVQLKPEDIARACCVEFVEVIDPYDLNKAVDVVERAIRYDGPSFIVFRRICTILEMRRRRKEEGVYAWSSLERKERERVFIPYHIDQEKCNEKCNACIKLFGCPAIVKEDGRTIVVSHMCVACGVCAQICPYNAIGKE